MEGLVKSHLPGATVSVESINREYRSWRMVVTTPHRELEFVWGPLTGFGGSDLRRECDNPFVCYDQGFSSLEEAERFLISDAG